MVLEWGVLGIARKLSVSFAKKQHMPSPHGALCSVVLMFIALVEVMNDAEQRLNDPNGNATTTLNLFDLCGVIPVIWHHSPDLLFGLILLHNCSIYFLLSR